MISDQIYSCPYCTKELDPPTLQYPQTFFCTECGIEIHLEQAVVTTRLSGQS